MEVDSLKLASAAKLDDPTTVAFRWPACGQLFKLAHCFALGCHFQAQFAARLGLAVESLRNRGGTADIAEKQNLHLKVAAIVLHLQQVADSNLARSLGLLSVSFNSAEFTCPCGE